MDREHVGACGEVERAGRGGEIGPIVVERLVAVAAADGVPCGGRGHGVARDFNAIDPGDEAIVPAHPQPEGNDLGGIRHLERHAQAGGALLVLHAGRDVPALADPRAVGRAGIVEAHTRPAALPRAAAERGDRGLPVREVGGEVRQADGHPDLAGGSLGRGDRRHIPAEAVGNIGDLWRIGRGKGACHAAVRLEQREVFTARRQGKSGVER